MEKPKTPAEIRRQDFYEHGKTAIEIANLAISQIDEVLGETSLSTDGSIQLSQSEVSFGLSGGFNHGPVRLT